MTYGMRTKVILEDILKDGYTLGIREIFLKKIWS
jgi:hypothetical protein